MKHTLIPTKDAAKRFGVCTETIRRALHAGHIAGRRVGPRRLLVDAESAQAYFAQELPAQRGDA